MDCLFCKIINGEIPSDKVYEDEFVYAFKDMGKGEQETLTYAEILMRLKW